MLDHMFSKDPDYQALKRMECNPNLTDLALKAERFIFLSKKYEEFAIANPNLANYLLSGISVGAKTLVDAGSGAVIGGTTGLVGGPGAGALAEVSRGFYVGVIDELKGSAIDAVAGEQIGAVVKLGIDQGAKVYSALDSSLTQAQAQALAGASVFGSMMALPHAKAAIKQTVGHVSKMGAKIKAGLNDLHAPSMATAGGVNVSQNFLKDNHSGNSSSSTHHSIDPTNRNNSNFAKEAHLNATDQSKLQSFNSKNNPGEIISGKIVERSSIKDHELQGYYNPLAAEAMVKFHHPEAVSRTIAKANAKNARLAGKIHSKTGVPFNERGFPDFDAHKVADVRINIKSSDPKYKNDHGYIINDEKHKKLATLELRSAIDKGFVDKKFLLPNNYPKYMRVMVVKLKRQSRNIHSIIMKIQGVCN